MERNVVETLLAEQLLEHLAGGRAQRLSGWFPLAIHGAVPAVTCRFPLDAPMAPEIGGVVGRHHGGNITSKFQKTC
ncbi:hypothetical protein ABZV14_41845 [Streptosporangium canum]|uniref:hypothetical protein n=1 Tax=Streptosporangium canum TaxID=324952 RepID=UPI0033B73D21